MAVRDIIFDFRRVVVVIVGQRTARRAAVTVAWPAPQFVYLCVYNMFYF